MNKIKVSIMAIAISMSMSPVSVFAEDSEDESTSEELELALSKREIPEAIKAFMDYSEELQRRYPDSARIDPKAFVAEEGEQAALMYCKAIGIDGPCVLDGKGEDSRYVGLSHDVAARGWWDWINDHLFNVGVIPEQNACPAPYTKSEILMNDEDRRNANWRDGWIGATLSGRDTLWRFCRLDKDKSIEFRPWAFAGNQYDYAVLSLGFFCPSGGRIVWRYQDNEDRGAFAGASGDIFPNGFDERLNWWTKYCFFDGAAQSDLGYMSAWPNIGAAYGLFTSYRMPFVLARGRVFQDDEDNNNQNQWQGWPDEVMWDSRNTGRHLGKVR